MFQQSNVLLGINLPLLLNNQSLLQIFKSSGLQVVNKTPINTKESFLIELENSKPAFSFLYTNLAGVIGLQEVLTKAKQSSPNTKLVLITNENDKGKFLSYLLANVSAIVSVENLISCADIILKQASRGQMFLCGKSISDLRLELECQKSNIKLDEGLLDALTDRELEVLHSLTKGINYKQISKELYISESTVKTHVNNIFTKLNVNDRTQAVLYALNHGITSLLSKTHILENVLNKPVEQ